MVRDFHNLGFLAESHVFFIDFSEIAGIYPSDLIAGSGAGSNRSVACPGDDGTMLFYENDDGLLFLRAIAVGSTGTCGEEGKLDLYEPTEHMVDLISRYANPCFK